MVLQIQLRTASSIPIEIEGVTPDAVRGRPLAEIERLPIFHGNRELPLVELFSIRGVADETLEFTGDLSGVHGIGAKMTNGRIKVHGSAGRHVGARMRGGEILVEGDAGDWLGAELRGGTIRVRGRTGDCVGAAYRGASRGMTNGTILIDGAAGNEVGAGMRRGLIAIGGAVGDFAGYRMLAGTIVVLGAAGVRHGAEMKRGTLAFLGARPPMLPTFRRACRGEPTALKLLRRHLEQRGFALPEISVVDVFNGDFLSGGRGEIWFRAEV